MEDEDIRPPGQYDRAEPKDSLDSDASREDVVDGALQSWNRGRSDSDTPAGPAGELTNMEVLSQETHNDLPETDPFPSDEE